MFPAPRQRWVDAMCSAEADIRALPHETLMLHGREDRVIPLANSLTLAQWIPNSQLHVFGPLRPLDADRACGALQPLVGDFFAEADAAGAMHHDEMSMKQFLNFIGGEFVATAGPSRTAHRSTTA
jgi:2-hydroxymuconate-semialdehyde hydrolase